MRGIEMSNIWIIIGALAWAFLLFGFIRLLFARLNKHPSYCFDAQDLDPLVNPGRILPKSAATGTFQPMLKLYLDLTKLLITLAAASITFGGIDSQVKGIFAAKMILATTILLGVLFCASVLYRYDEYQQNVHSYTRWWYCTVEALAFSTLANFFVGYFVWAIFLKPV